MEFDAEYLFFLACGFATGLLSLFFGLNYTMTHSAVLTAFLWMSILGAGFWGYKSKRPFFYGVLGGVLFLALYIGTMILWGIIHLH